MNLSIIRFIMLMSQFLRVYSLKQSSVSTFLVEHIDDIADEARVPVAALVRISTSSNGELAVAALVWWGVPIRIGLLLLYPLYLYNVIGYSNYLSLTQLIFAVLLRLLAWSLYWLHSSKDKLGWLTFDLWIWPQAWVVQSLWPVYCNRSGILRLKHLNAILGWSWVGPWQLLLLIWGLLRRTDIVSLELLL